MALSSEAVSNRDMVLLVALTLLAATVLLPPRGLMSTLFWPTVPTGPVQGRTDADERDAGVKNCVTADMHETLVADRSYEAEDFSGKNANRTRGRKSERQAPATLPQPKRATNARRQCIRLKKCLADHINLLAPHWRLWSNPVSRVVTERLFDDKSPAVDRELTKLILAEPRPEAWAAENLRAGNLFDDSTGTATPDEAVR